MFEQLRDPVRLSALLVMLANGAAPAVARACSGFSCQSGSFNLAKDSTIPANAPALLWLPPIDYANTTGAPAVLHLTRVDGSDEQEVAIEVEDRTGHVDRVVQLPDGLVAGARYRLSVTGDVACLPEPLEFVAGDEAPLPRQLGHVVASKPERGFITIATVSGSCDTTWPAVISDVDLELAAEAKPWAPLLRYTARVDGKAWQPSWTLGPDGPYELTGAQTKLYAECGGTAQENGQPLDQGASHDGAGEGPHELLITATIPGSVDTLSSDPITVDLECNAQPPAEPPHQQSSQGTGGPPPPSSDTQSTAPAQAGHGPIEPQAGRSSVDAGVAPKGEEHTVERTEVDSNSGGSSDDCAVISPGRADRGSGRWDWLRFSLAALGLSARRNRARRIRLLTGR